MPRRARLDFPGLLHHVMARGIEGAVIFRDNEDREEFLRRLSQNVADGRARLFAWVLMSNHVHILLRPETVPLSTIMRRLLTGYAVWHNRRYSRKGHLFQNRYKSIIAEEDPYFLELVRYIHLNPIRAGLVKEMSELDRYPYSGHSVIMGNHKYKPQDVLGVLEFFGQRTGAARKEYHHFTTAGIEKGGREDLRGGGLIRSSGGREKLDQRIKEEPELGDERILGSGTFVEEVLKGHEREKAKAAVLDFENILEGICQDWRVSREQILSGARTREISQARRAFFLRAHEETGQSFASLGRLCGLSHTSVREAIAKARMEFTEKQ